MRKLLKPTAQYFFAVCFVGCLKNVFVKVGCEVRKVEK